MLDDAFRIPDQLTDVRSGHALGSADKSPRVSAGQLELRIVSEYVEARFSIGQRNNEVAIKALGRPVYVKCHALQQRETANRPESGVAPGRSWSCPTEGNRVAQNVARGADDRRSGIRESTETGGEMAAG